MRITDVVNQLRQSVPFKLPEGLTLEGADEWDFEGANEGESFSFASTLKILLPANDGVVYYNGHSRMRLFGSASLLAVHAQRESMPCWLLDNDVVPFAVNNTDSLHCIDLRAGSFEVNYLDYPDWVRGESSGSDPRIMLKSEQICYSLYHAKMFNRLAAGSMF